jgi:hypothetical protein
LGRQDRAICVESRKLRDFRSQRRRSSSPKVSLSSRV